MDTWTNDTELCYLLGMYSAACRSAVESKVKVVSVIWGEWAVETLKPKRMSAPFFNDVIDLFLRTGHILGRQKVSLDVPEGIELSHINIVVNDSELLMKNNREIIDELFGESVSLASKRFFLRGVLDACSTASEAGDLIVSIPTSIKDAIARILSFLLPNLTFSGNLTKADLLGIGRGNWPLMPSKVARLSNTPICTIKENAFALKETLPVQRESSERPSISQNYPSSDDMYVLGFLAGKGTATRGIDDQSIFLRAYLKFNKNRIWDVRGDNVHRSGDPGPEIAEYALPDVLKLTALFQRVFGFPVVPERLDIDEQGSFRKKEIVWTIGPLYSNHEIMNRLFPNKTLDQNLLEHPPDYLMDVNIPKEQARTFLQGVSDATAVIPGQESAAFGSKGRPRIQLEPDNCRWYWLVPICFLFQRVLGIPVLNNNVPHPTIKCRKKPTSCLEHNHQMRICAYYFRDVNFRFAVKRIAYERMFEKNEIPDPGERVFCPDNRRSSFEVVEQGYYRRRFEQGKVTNITTEPYSCTEHEEGFEKLPPEIRGKHYSEFRLVCRDLGCPYVKGILGGSTQTNL